MSAVGTHGIGEEAVQRELQPGEERVWVGRPDARRLSMQKGWITFLFGIPFSAFAGFWIFIVARQGDYFFVSGIPFLLIGLGFLGHPIWEYWKAARTIYAVTNRRIMIIGGVRPSRVKSFTPPFDLERRERRDGSGAIMFGQEPAFPGLGPTYSVRTGFFAIPRVRDVERHILDLTTRH